MAKTFKIRVVTPKRELISDEVSEVVLPAYDGERGILPEHQSFVGRLGTGPLKIVKDEQDYWYMVSDGVYEFEDCKLNILARVGKEAKEIIPEEEEKIAAQIRSEVAEMNTWESEYQEKLTRLKEVSASLAVHQLSV